MEAGRDKGAWTLGGAGAAIRSNGSPIAGPELRLLMAIAGKLPLWVTPNQMTALGFAGALLCCAGYILSGEDWRFLNLSIAGYVVHWLGDGLDGNLARLRKIERPVFGAYLDQTVDVLSIGLTILGLGLSPYVRLDVALFAMIPYLLLVLLRQMRAHVTGIDEIAHGGIGGTEGRIVLIAMTVAMIDIGPRAYTFSFGQFSSFDMGIVLIGVWAIIAFAAGSIAVLKELAEIDPPRRFVVPEAKTELPQGAAAIQDTRLG